MSTHRQIFKSTALIGGTQVINMSIGAVRNKALAVLLGPSGMGLAGLYITATALIGSVAGLGLNASGVRQVAEAAGTHDETRIARTIANLRRLTLISGVLGMALVLALAPLLSQTTFGDSKHIFAIALMSLTLLFGGISAGQSALLQGLRRLRDLAASQIVGTLVGAVVSVGLVWWLREQGIVPYLVAGSALAALLSWWYARRVSVRRVTLTWRETLKESRGLLGLGLAFTFSGLVGSGTDYFLRVLVQRQLSMEAVGIYTATWTLSTYYVGFVLTAMCTDFMPRLTAAANDHSTMNRLLNEQIEMGVLIALPGVLASLTLAPWVLKIFYSASFMNGAAMARWQILGMFLRVVSWPLGYVLIAKGRGLLFTLTELAFGVTNVGLILLCMKLWKLEGVGVSFALCYLLHTAITTIIARWLTGFRWSAVALRIFAPAILILGAVFGCARFLPARWSLCIGLAATALAGAACLLALQKLLGVNLWQAVRRKFQEGSL